MVALGCGEGVAVGVTEGCGTSVMIACAGVRVAFGSGLGVGWQAVIKATRQRINRSHLRGEFALLAGS